MKRIYLNYSDIGFLLMDNLNINPSVRDIFSVGLYWGELEHIKRKIKHETNESKYSQPK